MTRSLVAAAATSAAGLLAALALPAAGQPAAGASAGAGGGSVAAASAATSAADARAAASTWSLMPTFQWPELLWLLVLLPLLVLAYLWLLRRRKRSTVRLASLGLVKQAMGRGPGWRRHVPPALLLAAIGVLLLAAARPMARLKLPSQQETIILAMDVSGSMRAADVKPNRITAAQEAAKAFVAGLPRNVKIGVVQFAGTAAVVQPPTLSRDDVVAAIDRFQLQRGTAIGSGLILSMATLFPDEGIDLSQITGQRAMPGGPGEQKEKKPVAPVEPGSYSSAAIILLTDGQRTTGPDPMEGAKLAAEHGVKVYTVGVGTKNGEIIGFEGWSMRVRLDEDTLKAIANATRANYFYAGTAEDLKQVYEGLSTRLVVETRETEVSALFALVGVVLVVLGAGLGVWWFGRVV